MLAQFQERVGNDYAVATDFALSEGMTGFNVKIRVMREGFRFDQGVSQGHATSQPSLLVSFYA